MRIRPALALAALLAFVAAPSLTSPAFAALKSKVVNYEQGVKPFLTTDRLSDSERAMLMGGACAKAYRWSPK